jgi:hypothetical protein
MYQMHLYYQHHCALPLPNGALTCWYQDTTSANVQCPQTQAHVAPLQPANKAIFSFPLFQTVLSILACISMAQKRQSSPRPYRRESWPMRKFPSKVRNARSYDARLHVLPSSLNASTKPTTQTIETAIGNAEKLEPITHIKCSGNNRPAV